VQAIAEAHGGRIELRPAESTRGASFRLTLC
jgi:signal transduction histidine kinase